MNNSEYPKVSIIIPCYNYENYICNTLESCLAQDYKGKVEVIVVDDCSTDHSVMMVERHFKGQVRLLRLPQNMGYSTAKNEGIRVSTGEYITAIDADDMLTEDSVSVRSQFLFENPRYLLVYAQAYIIKGDGDLSYWKNRLYKIEVSHREDKIHAQTVMVRREVYVNYGLYDEKLRSRSDNEMWNRLRNVANIGGSFYSLRHPVAYYRKHDRSMIQYRKKNPEYNDEVSRILEEQKNLRLMEGITKKNTRHLKK